MSSGAPIRRPSSGLNLFQGIDERVHATATAARFISSSAPGLGSLAGVGGNGGSGGGTVDPPPGPQGPLHSPWYQNLVAVANNANTDFPFGLVSVVSTVAVRLTLKRYAGAGDDPVVLAKLRVVHDGSTPTLLPEKEWNRDTLGLADFGVTLSVNITGGYLQLNVAADASGGDVSAWVQWQYEGVTAGSAKGEFSLVRGTRRTSGNWGIITNGLSVYGYFTPGGSDDLGISVAGDITSGVLELTVSADSSDGNDTTVALTTLVCGFAGGRGWERDDLVVTAGGSANTVFRSDADGQIDWGSADLAPQPSASASAAFDHSFGALWILADVYRGTLVEIHEIPLWRHATGVALEDDPWIDQSAGLAFSAGQQGASLVLSAAADANPDLPVVRATYLGVPAFA